MKNIKYFVFSCLLFVLFIGGVEAASLSVAANKSTVVVGSTVNVTVTANGAAGWEYCLSFDESLFTLTGAPTDTGGKCVLTGSTLIGYSKVTFTLKAKKSGTGTVGLSNYAMYDDNGNAVGVSAGSVRLTNKTQAEIEASYSTNANLKSLVVENYELSPAFDVNTLEYNLEVDNDVEKVKIIATKADYNASISGGGEVDLQEGLNTFNIVVTAQKGNQKKYVVSITRKELNPIEINVDGKKLFVVRKTDGLEVPNYYASDVDKFSGANYISVDEKSDEIPVFKSEISGYTLIALRDEEGNVDFYIWDKITDSYRLYTDINSGNLFIAVEQPDVLLDEAKNSKEMMISNKKVVVYKLDNSEDFVLIYGMNAETGEKNWYKYDVHENTFQRYDNKLLKGYKEDLDNYKKLVYMIGGIACFFILLSFILFVKNLKKKKIIKNGIVIEEDEDEEVEEKVEEEKKEEPVEEVKEEPVKEEKKDTKKKEKKLSKNEKIKEIRDILDNKEDLKIEEVKEVKEEVKSENLKEIEKEEEKELSKREIRRLEKERMKKEREELKKMQDDFLDD